ncbi:MAG: PGPGW domain-containing protein [Planctomycetes bacterium]|nr:PGPGW domain-containing protein [Planctomycetota bacterium]MBI3834293.1 PGPGW domain-containing protein [Planctomycetota bacterium]
MVIKTTKRIVIAIVGGSVVIVGIVMLVAPGPGTIVIPAGLAILGTEFAWARWVLKRMKEKATSVMNSVRGNTPPPPNNAKTSATK